MALSVNVLASDYNLDRHHALENSLPFPNHVDLYLTGPKEGIDKYMFDWLPTGKAGYSTTNNAEIAGLLKILENRDYQQRITNSGSKIGYTYHLLLFNDANKTVIHYYVFDLNDTNTAWCNVFPRSETGTIWFNKEIGSWLHERLNTPKEIQEKQESSTSTNKININPYIKLGNALKDR